MNQANCFYAAGLQVLNFGQY